MWRVTLWVLLLLVNLTSIGSAVASVPGGTRWEVEGTVASAESAEMLSYIPAWRSIMDRVLRRALRRGTADLLPRIRAARWRAIHLLSCSGYGCSALLASLVGPAGRVWSWAL